MLVVFKTPAWVLEIAGKSHQTRPQTIILTVIEVCALQLRHPHMLESSWPDGTWAPGVRRAVWARGVRAVVQFGVESSVLCPVLGQAMWRMGR